MSESDLAVAKSCYVSQPTSYRVSLLGTRLITRITLPGETVNSYESNSSVFFFS